MASYVWGGDYDFAEHACEITDDVQSSLTSMKIFCESLVLGARFGARIVAKASSLSLDLARPRIYPRHRSDTIADIVEEGRSRAVPRLVRILPQSTVSDLSADASSHRIHPHFQKVAHALNGKAERAEAALKASTKAERKRQNSDGKQELARQQLVRDSEWVQRGATAIMFAFWGAGAFIIWIVASSKFLLQGDDPWTFGQVSCCATKLPSCRRLQD